MKKFFHYLLPMAFACILLTSCQIDDLGVERDETLLHGKWLLTLENGKEPINPVNELPKEEYWRYNSNGTGSTWDESDDMYEDEALPFTWTLVQSELTQIHVTEMSAPGTRADVPKIYEVTELTATKLSYKDALGYSATFTKQ